MMPNNFSLFLVLFFVAFFSDRFKIDSLPVVSLISNVRILDLLREPYAGYKILHSCLVISLGAFHH